MLRTATPKELKKPLGDVFAALEATSESLLIREDGQAVAALLTGPDYELYREWIATRAWTMIDEVRKRNAHLTADEIAEEIDRIVQEVRSEARESRAAS